MYPWPKKKKGRSGYIVELKVVEETFGEKIFGLEDIAEYINSK